MKKKIFGVLLCLCMVMALLPTTALAEGEHPHSESSNHPLCQVNCGLDHNGSAGGTGHEAVTWTQWVGTDRSGEYGIQIAAGNYYLTEDVTVDYYIDITDGTVNLCLNGYTIQYEGSCVFKIENGATLNLCDCGSGGTVKYTGANNGSDSVYSGIENLGTFNMYGGTLQAVSNTSVGIYNYQGGKVNIYGGTVDGTASGAYNGIFNKSGSVNVYGGTVSGSEYGIYNNASTCSATVSGGTVKNTYGPSSTYSGIYNGGTLTVSSGTIQGTGYGIYNAGKINLSGAPVITGGTADTYADIYGTSE